MIAAVLAFACHRLPACGAGLLASALLAEPAWAHAVAEGDKGYIQEISGVLTAPYDGSHGWFRRNRGSADVTLKVNGAYTEIRRVN